MDACKFKIGDLVIAPRAVVQSFRNVAGTVVSVHIDRHYSSAQERTHWLIGVNLFSDGLVYFNDYKLDLLSPEEAALFLLGE